MDKKLAEIYGTNVSETEDVEKLAAAQLAENLAKDEGMDLASLSPEQIEELAAAVLAEDSEAAADEEEEKEPAEKQASAEPEISKVKIAEADYLGRIMAHAYVQELRDLEKKASMEEKGAKEKKAAPAEAEEQMSALDTLAVARAQAWMKENGIELPSEANAAEPEVEKKSSGMSDDQREALAKAVDERAYDMLVAAGVINPEAE